MGDATYALADGVLHGCGDREDQCLRVNRSDPQGMQPMPCLMAYCTAVVTVKASACVSADEMHGGCDLCLGRWCCMTVVTMKASASVSRSDAHWMQPMPWPKLLYDWGQ